MRERLRRNRCPGPRLTTSPRSAVTTPASRRAAQPVCAVHGADPCSLGQPRRARRALPVPAADGERCLPPPPSPSPARRALEPAATSTSGDGAVGGSNGSRPADGGSLFPRLLRLPRSRATAACCERRRSRRGRRCQSCASRRRMRRRLDTRPRRRLRSGGAAASYSAVSRGPRLRSWGPQRARALGRCR